MIVIQKTRLTKRVVDSATQSDRLITIWDSEIPGFGLKVHPSGRKTYVYKYRVGGGRGGRRREPTLGVHGVLTPDQARKLALNMAREVGLGNDPSGLKDRIRKAPTMAALFERYIEQHAKPFKKASSLRNDKRLIAKVLLPAFGRIKVREIMREDISSLHASMGDRPYEANRTLALLSKLFSLAELWGLREDATNPCRHVKRFKEMRRERLLSEQELARLGSALQHAANGSLTAKDGTTKAIFPPALAAIRLLLFTGARSGEILGLKWEWINWDLRRAELPDSKTGQKFVYLPPPAMEVLSRLRNEQPDRIHVIHGKQPGTQLVNLKDSWGFIRRCADLEDVRVHDLRHCVASSGAMSGRSLPMIGALLGHKDIATTQRYAHLSDNPIRSASDQIGSRLSTLLGEIPSSPKARQGIE